MAAAPHLNENDLPTLHIYDSMNLRNHHRSNLRRRRGWISGHAGVCLVAATTQRQCGVFVRR
jgi:hypothetical protein